MIARRTSRAHPSFATAICTGLELLVKSFKEHPSLMSRAAVEAMVLHNMGSNTKWDDLIEKAWTISPRLFGMARTAATHSSGTLATTRPPSMTLSKLQTILTMQSWMRRGPGWPICLPASNAIMSSWLQQRRQFFLMIPREITSS